MGTTSFGIPGLDALSRAGHQIVGIVSTPARQKGRGLKIIESDITLHAKEAGYEPVFCPQNLKSDHLVSDLKRLGADIFVVVAFRILPPEIFSIPEKGTYNVHASLLPRYRGPAPIQRALAAGETETGITVFRIDRGIDTGTIVLQRKTGIGDQETTPALSARLALLGAEGICEAVSLIQNSSVVFAAQDATQATPAPKLTKSEGKIVWDTPARTLYNTIRAFTPFPGTYSFVNGQRFAVEWAMPVVDPGNAREDPGTVLSVVPDGFDVQCRASVLRVMTVRPEGKKSMGGRDFAMGRNIGKGTRLE